MRISLCSISHSLLRPDQSGLFLPRCLHGDLFWNLTVASTGARRPPYVRRNLEEAEKAEKLTLQFEDAQGDVVRQLN